MRISLFAPRQHLTEDSRRRHHLVSLIVSVAAVAACPACSSSDDGDEPTPDAGVMPDVGFVDSGVVGTTPFDLTGTWASYRVSSQCFDGALGTDRVLFYWVAKHTFTQSNTDATMTTEVCDLTLTDYRDSQSAYPGAAIAGFDARDVAIVLGGTTVGSSFTTQRQLLLLGWTPDADPFTEALPQMDTDARLRDVDNDSNPGATLTVTGFVSGDVYIANRNIVTSTGIVDSPDRITGTNEVAADQFIVGASAILLNNNSTVVTQDTGEQSSPFEMVRLSSDLSCSDIVSMADQLFTLVGAEPTSACP